MVCKTACAVGDVDVYDVDVYALHLTTQMSRPCMSWRRLPYMSSDVDCLTPLPAYILLHLIPHRLPCMSSESSIVQWVTWLGMRLLWINLVWCNNHLTSNLIEWSNVKRVNECAVFYSVLRVLQSNLSERNTAKFGDECLFVPVPHAGESTGRGPFFSFLSLYVSIFLYPSTYIYRPKFFLVFLFYFFMYL